MICYIEVLFKAVLTVYIYILETKIKHKNKIVQDHRNYRTMTIGQNVLTS